MRLSSHLKQEIKSRTSGFKASDQSANLTRDLDRKYLSSFSFLGESLERKDVYIQRENTQVDIYYPEFIKKRISETSPVNIYYELTALSTMYVIVYKIMHTLMHAVLVNHCLILFQVSWLNMSLLRKFKHKQDYYVYWED